MQASVYVNGSYRDGIYSAVCVVLVGDECKTAVSHYNDTFGIRGIAGKLHSAAYAVRWALQNGVDELAIYYDFDGVQKWADGEWKANHAAAQKYQTLVQNARRRISINFIKVKAHSGDYWNEMSARLANEELEKALLQKAG